MDSLTRNHIRAERDKAMRARKPSAHGRHKGDASPTPDIPGTWLMVVRKPRTQIRQVPWVDDYRT